MSSQHFPALFQAKSLELIHQLIPVKSSVFFLVNPDMRHQGAYVFNVPSDIEKQYTSLYFELDPLNAKHFSDPTIKMATLDSMVHEQDLLVSRYYQEFMQPFQHRYVLDLFFRNARGEIIAVISLLRSKLQDDFTKIEQNLLHATHAFMEYTLNTVYLPKRDSERNQLASLYALTERELDVIECLLSGASNKDIARRIDMGMATLKTHLQHIYRKANVNSRTELLSQLVKCM